MRNPFVFAGFAERVVPTVNPLRCNSCATAAPMPDEAPVIKTVADILFPLQSEIWTSGCDRCILASSDSKKPATLADGKDPATPKPSPDWSFDLTRSAP
jgi:hypothetical protein